MLLPHREPVCEGRSPVLHRKRVHVIWHGCLAAAEPLSHPEPPMSVACEEDNLIGHVACGSGDHWICVYWYCQVG